MQNENFNFKTARENIDLVDYLASLGHQPTRQNNHEYWYRSPLREEKTASFKIDRNKQVWYDHGTGKGGDLIDFVREYFHYDFKEVLQKCRDYLNVPQEQRQAVPPIADTSGSQEKEPDGTEKEIHVLAVRPIEKAYLKSYIGGRHIPFSLAGRFLKEIDYRLYGKTYTALGFPNDGGGYELRNKYFKGSSKPKSPTIILLNEEQKPIPEQKLAVFEGFFSMLSFLTLLEKEQLFVEKPDNILVLNSLSFLNKSQELITAYGHTDLYLDNDSAGQKATEQALSWSDNISDRRYLYEGVIDFNAFITEQKKEQEAPERSYKMRR